MLDLVAAALAGECDSDVLPPVPDWCVMRGVLGSCLSADPAALCRACTLLEIGERMGDLVVRTNAGIPKGKFYRDQERAFQRELAESRGRPVGRSRLE